MGNIEKLFCKGKPEGHQCVDHNGQINCLRIENMKMVPCDHLNVIMKVE